MSLARDLRQAVEEKPYNADCFDIQLFRLFLKADLQNRARLTLAFPKHAEMVTHWDKTGQYEEVSGQ